MTDLDYGLRVHTPTGWLDLEDEANGYTLDDTTTGQIATTRRDRTVAGQWVEGTFTTASVKDNETVPVGVWVLGNDPVQLSQRLDVLKAAFDQLSYQVEEVFGGATFVWTCMAAPYTITSSGPLRFALEAQFQAQVPRLPTLAVTYS